VRAEGNAFFDRRLALMARMFHVRTLQEGARDSQLERREKLRARAAGFPDAEHTSSAARGSLPRTHGLESAARGWPFDQCLSHALEL